MVMGGWEGWEMGVGGVPRVCRFSRAQRYKVRDKYGPQS